MGCELSTATRQRLAGPRLCIDVSNYPSDIFNAGQRWQPYVLFSLSFGFHLADPLAKDFPHKELFRDLFTDHFVPAIIDVNEIPIAFAPLCLKRAGEITKPAARIIQRNALCKRRLDSRALVPHA